MLDIIINKILLGIGLAAPIGPVSAEMIKRGLAVGFWGSFNVRLGGAIANIILLVLAYFGLSKLLQYPKIVFTISAIGVIALMYLGIKNIIKGINNRSLNILKHKINCKQKYSFLNGIIVGFSLSFFCPISLMFWLSTFATSSVDFASNQVFDINDLLINLFIIVGILLWGIFISTILHFFSRIVDQTKIRIITILSGFILIYFGCKYGVVSYGLLSK